MDIYDYIVIVFYLLFMLVIGVVFRSFNKSTSDYFRGGGSMLWWMSGASGFMVLFTAWTFTGAAGKIYETGTLVLVLYGSNFLASISVYIWTSYRFRRMRVITYAEAILLRYGRVTEQFYAYILIPFGIIFAGIALNAVSVFGASTLGISVETTTIVIGSVMLIMSVTGGAWAVVASSFIQLIILLTITLVVTFFALRLPEVGGITGLINKLPPSHFNWSLLENTNILWLWSIAMFINQIMFFNNMTDGAARFLTVKNDKHARWAAMVTVIGMLVCPLLWLIPPLVARVIFPDIASMFPNLTQPAEASYIAVCMKVMPHGLIGMLLCGIFSATTSTVDAGLNRNAGIFIRNFYHPILRPHAQNRELMIVSKLSSIVFGILIITVGVVVSRYRQLGLFDLILIIGSILIQPLTVPMFLGFFIKRVPSWSGWSTVLVGFITGFGTRLFFNPDWAQFMIGQERVFTARERIDLLWIATVFSVNLMGLMWYFFTKLFYKNSTVAYKKNEATFFRNLATPIDTEKEGIKCNDGQQYHVLGLLCICYGIFISLFVLIPNEISGRIAFLFCGMLPLVIGILFYSIYRRIQKKENQNMQLPKTA